MASIKISELNEYTEVKDDDLFPIVDVANGETKKVKATNIGTGGKELIMVGDESVATSNTKLLIEQDSLNSLGTEVVDSLDGNETDRAPSVKTIKEKINGFILYENSNGTNSNFELSDNVSNYRYFEIYYTERQKRNFGFIKVSKEFINEIPLSVVFNDNTYMYIVNIGLKLNNKNATFTNSAKRIALNTTTSIFQDSEIYVFKIIGYK